MDSMSGDVPAINNPHASTASGAKENRDATTVDTNDAMSIVAGRMNPVSMDSTLTSTGSSLYTQGVKEFLQKPVVVATGTISTLDSTPGVDLTGFPIVLDAVWLSSFPVWWQKLQGYMGIRATLRLRLQVNANPFQQGRVMMFYYPATDAYVTGGNWKRDHITCRSQAPNVQLDYACDTEATLEVPYIHLQSHLNIPANTGAWGKVSLTPWIALDTGSGGETTITYTLWASLHDVELVAPTSQTATSQMAVVKRKSNQTTRKPPSDQEASREMGPISAVLNGVSKISEILSGVPMLSSIAGPVAWATNIGSNVASSFGWSKPLLELPQHRVLSTKNQNTAVSDTLDYAYSLGMSAVNKVCTLPAMGGVDIDEMSISYLAQVYAYWREVAWADTLPRDTSLITFDVTPYTFRTATLPLGFAVTPLNWVSGFFNNWRGSIKIRLKFAKTQFHSGRLLVLYEPYRRYQANGDDNATPVVVTNQQSDYVHRQIIDLRESSEAEIIIPYVNMYPYLPWQSSCGTVDIRVLNILRHPETCASTVRFTVEVAGGPDIEFAWPSTSCYFSYKEVVPVGALAAGKDFDTDEDFVGPEKYDAPPLEYAEAQMDFDKKESCEFAARMIGDSGAPSASTDFAQACVGEKVMSLKQLCNRACWTSGANVINATSGSMRPFRLKPVQNLGAGNDYIDAVCPAFAFSRGGVVVRAMDYATATGYSSQVHSMSLFRSRLDDIFPSAPTSALLPRVIETPFNNMFAAHVPQYTQSFGRINACDDTVHGGQFFYRSSAALVFNRTPHLGTVITPANVYSCSRVASDAWHCSFFIGVPICNYIIAS
jgi:hypothetical protein